MKKSILTIEDEVYIRESFAAFLEDHGYTVYEAGDGEEGLGKIESEEPDLVLVDLRMPKMDGLQVLGHIMKNTPEIPVIVVSGTGEIHDVIEAMHRGAWDYVLKPVEDLNILLYAVKRAMEKLALSRKNKEYRENLEEQVREKTRELREANSKLQRINSELKEIVKTTGSLASINQLDQFGSLVLKDFGRHLFATGGSLYMVEESGLRKISSLDPGHAPDFIPFPLNERSPFALVMKKGEALYIENFSDWKIEGLLSSGWDGYGNGSFLVLPVPDIDHDIMAILSIHSKANPAYETEEREIASLLAAFCSEGLKATSSYEKLKQHEAELQKSLEERNILINEVHHRVKNNLQIIISLLNLQKPLFQHRADRKHLNKTIRRIQAMAMAYEHLYHTGDFTQISLKNYLESLIQEIFVDMTTVGSNIGFEVISRDFSLGIEYIIPVGLIVYELVDNALAHAFKAGKGGKVLISAGTEHGRYFVEVRDNGIGIPDNVDESGTLGFMLVRSLTSQLNGRLTIDNDSGSTLKIDFSMDGK